MGTKIRQEIAKQRKYKKMSAEAKPDSWSAQREAYAGTSLKASNPNIDSCDKLEET